MKISCGKIIKAFLKSNDISYTELSRMTGISIKRLGDIENDKVIVSDFEIEQISEIIADKIYFNMFIKEKV